MEWEKQFDKQTAEYLPDLKIVRDEPMSRHTSFHIGGPARRMAFPASGEQLVLLMNFAEACGARPLVIGNGTNLLIPDEGLDRLVIDTSAGMNRLEVAEDSCVIMAEAGVSLARLAVTANYAGSLPWIATMVTAAWGAYGTSAACYYAKAKAENTAGGVTYETVCRGPDCER